MKRRTARSILFGLTLVALVLRLYRLGSDLWLDEIAAYRLYEGLSVWQVLTDYTRPSNHFLNTILVNLMSGWFGPREWAIRLPAVLFGVATIPVLYWVTRRTASRFASLIAAALLTFSHVHIFFSQNARGYTGYLFFNLLATLFLIEIWNHGTRKTAMFYAVSMWLALISMPLSWLVLGSHLLVSIAQRYLQPPLTGERPAGLQLGWLAMGSAILGGLMVYLPVLRQVTDQIGEMYVRDRIGYSPLSLEFFSEVIRGLLGRVSPVLAGGLVIAAVVAGVGVWTLWHRDWRLVSALSMPLILTFLLLVIADSTAYPRFFLLFLPLGMMALAQGVVSTGRGLLQPWLGGQRSTLTLYAITVIMVAASAFPLEYYYGNPKQSYRAAIAFLEPRVLAGSRVAVADLAMEGFLFYNRGSQLVTGRTLFFLRSATDLDQILESEHPQGLLLVTSFTGGLRSRWPELATLLETGWVQERVFPATVGDGEIVVWRLSPGH